MKKYVQPLGRIQHMFIHSFDFSKRLANLYIQYKTLEYQHLQQTNKN